MFSFDKKASLDFFFFFVLLISSKPYPPTICFIETHPQDAKLREKIDR